MVEDDLQGRRPSVEDNFWWQTILACCLVRFAAFFWYDRGEILTGRRHNLKTGKFGDNIYSCKILNQDNNKIPYEKIFEENVNLKKQIYLWFK